MFHVGLFMGHYTSSNISFPPYVLSKDFKFYFTFNLANDVCANGYFF